MPGSRARSYATVLHVSSSLTFARSCLLLLLGTRQCFCGAAPQHAVGQPQPWAPPDHAHQPCLPLWPQVLQIQEGDVCLTLTSGGCNALNLCIQGAAQVVSVDCNPAQSALLELKAVAIQCALRSYIAYARTHACSHYVLAMKKHIAAATYALG